MQSYMTVHVVDDAAAKPSNTLPHIPRIVEQFLSATRQLTEWTSGRWAVREKKEREKKKKEKRTGSRRSLLAHTPSIQFVGFQVP
jgi:hypothetical protein